MEQIHLPMSGNELHDIVGPISRPKVGPTLLALLIAIVIEFVLSTPSSVNVKYEKIRLLCIM